jgi:hypothetical protein
MSCFTAFVSKLNRVSCHLGRQLMRNLLIFVALFFSALRGIGLGGRGSKISELPDGTLSGKVYSNDALGMRYEIPSGWIATADPKGPVSLDSRKPDGPVNQCSKVVLALHAPERGDRRFNSTATVLAIDPGCFPGAKFPRSLKDKAKILMFAHKIVNAFSNTPYISRDGADVDAMPLGGRLAIVLTGNDVINKVDGHDEATKEQLHVNTSFNLTEANGYWVAWTARADDASREEMKNSNISFKEKR